MRQSSRCRSGRSRLFALAAAMVLPILAATALWNTPVQSQSRQETLIIVRDIDDYVTNDPQRQYEYTAQMLDQSSYDTLVTVEAPDFTKIQPKLAQSWDISKDGLTYTFHLRQGVKFASGDPMTASDVRFSFLRLKNLQDNPSFFMDPVKDIAAVDDSTVRITLATPDASFLAALAAPPTGIVDSKIVAAHGGTDADNAKTADKATSWLNEQSAGQGPYRLTSFKKDETAVLERNPGYWGPKPYFAKIVFLHVKEPTTQREMVERGEADVAQDFDADIVAKITPGAKIKIVEGLSMNQAYMALNTNPEVSKELGDKRVRQAISYAIDYDGIIKGLARGAGVRPPAMFPMGILGVDATMSMVRQHDVAKSKQLLAEAGYAGGFAVKLNYWTAPLLGVPSDPLAAKLQADLGVVGIKATLEPKERSVMLTEYRQGKPQLMLASWSPDYLDPHPWADAFYRKGGPAAKRVFYDDPKATDLVAAGDRELDPKKRADIYKQLTQVVLDDVPFIMLIQPKSFVGVNPSIKGYAIHPIWFVTLSKLSR
jgi:peptide/nickel transport system substrate-binding protein